MKLLIVLSLIACGYADKLDRTYLPPASAATAGGSPGSLNAPLGAGPTGSGKAPGLSGFGRSNSAFGTPSGFAIDTHSSSGFGAPSNQHGQSAGRNFDAGFGRPAQNFGRQQAQDYQRSQPARSQAAAEQAAEILRSDNQNDGETFSYNFETSNGIAAEESGVATNGVQAQGAFSYSDDDGQSFRVAYTADENGYQPQGDHLPTPHPIPEEIQKSIEKNAQAAASGTQEGAYNPNEGDSASVSQQYNSNAPSSYSQTGSGAAGYNYNQPQGFAASGSAVRPQARAQGVQPQEASQSFQPKGSSKSFRPQGPTQGFQPQGPSQQLGAPNGSFSSARSSNAFGKSQSPSPLHGSPSNGPDATANTGAARQTQRANGFSHSQPSGSGANGFGPATSGFSNGFASSQPKPKSYQPQSGSFNAISQGPVGAQDESYQYNRPQGGSSFGRDSTGQYRLQNGAQPSRAQGSFPNAQGSFGSSGSISQGTFDASRPSGQGTFGLSASPKGPGFVPADPTRSAQAAFVPSGPAGQRSFGPASGSNGQSSFGPSSGTNGIGRSQGSFQASSMGSMPDSGYQYNRPGAQSGSQTQSGFNGSSNQGRPAQTFSGPRQPPSFSEEEGYKY